MKDLFDKISSYNIFNYLLPGILFVFILRKLGPYDFIQEDNLIGAFLYYFIGMVISRFGSLIIEPLLKRFRFVKFGDYKKFVLASQKDSKIELLSEVNNTYRTIFSMFLLIGLFNCYSRFETYFTISHESSLFMLAILTGAMFLFSYRKQTNYISKRIQANQ